jgi:lysophospholipase L1-like esterase
MAGVRFLVVFFLSLLALVPQAAAQTLTSSNVQINWRVDNRFRLFAEAKDFQAHERAWKQYLIHVDGQHLGEDASRRLISNSSVIGSEHVLNDRYIPFSRHLRRNYDWKGWAAGMVGRLCWDGPSRTHAACGSSEAYVVPKSHRVTLWLTARDKTTLFAEYNCEWRVGRATPEVAPCDEPVSLDIPWPEGASVSVAAEGESGISTDIQVKDLLIAGLGDSFASGEGNPDVPVTFSEEGRFRNLYPRRARNDGSGNAQWMDETCHRSLYGHQLRAALQIAVENPHSAVTFLGYACSGAAVDEGILGPQEHVEYVSRNGQVQAVSGSSKDTQMRWLLREICAVKPERTDGFWTCPGGQYRRPVDLLFLSIGGNDIGFSSLVSWATLRDNTTSKLAKYFGATVSPKQFAANMKDNLPGDYARLAKAIELAVPLRDGAVGFDSSRVVLTAYPDILEDERGQVCAAGNEGEDEDLYPANQSLDVWSSWLVVTPRKLQAAHDQLEALHRRMGDLAEDHGWQFAGRAYEDRPFRGHGFCARNGAVGNDPAEQLQMPCVGKAERETATCTQSWSGKQRDWRPYNPAKENYPYALRQRWVRSFNDAYLAINEKVITREGQIDTKASEAVFVETTGAMHPSAEGHAAMADAILMDVRPRVARLLGDGQDQE